MDEDEFNRAVADAIDSLPPEFSEKLSNVSIVVEDWPSNSQIKKMGLDENSLLFGLYQGVPQTKRGSNYSGVLPDKITLFKGPVLTVANTPEEIRAKVRSTVIHEIGHHFGLSDEELK
jgi:predicted Zn-dependent protease with MMP-like domain